MLPGTTLCYALDCSPSRLRAFIADPRNWPTWSVPSCEGVLPLPDGSWKILSIAGSGQLSIESKGDVLVFREGFEEGEWLIRCEVRGLGESSELVVTVARPSYCDREIFDDFIEMAKLRLRRLQKALGR